MTNLTDLARRVSELQGPDRGIDGEIHFAITNGVGCGYIGSGPRYTASLDAAMALVADGKLISLETYDDNGVYPEHVRASAWVQGAPRQFAATPASPSPPQP